MIREFGVDFKKSIWLAFLSKQLRHNFLEARSENRWKTMTFFGLNRGQDLGKCSAQPHQEFSGVPPRKNTKYVSDDIMK